MHISSDVAPRDISVVSKLLDKINENKPHIEALTGEELVLETWEDFIQKSFQVPVGSTYRISD